MSGWKDVKRFLEVFGAMGSFYFLYLTIKQSQQKPIDIGKKLDEIILELRKR